MTGQGIRNAVEAGVDSIEDGTEIDKETLALMAKKGVFLVPTSAAQSADYESATPGIRRVVPAWIDLPVPA